MQLRAVGFAWRGAQCLIQAVKGSAAVERHTLKLAGFGCSDRALDLVRQAPGLSSH